MPTQFQAPAIFSTRFWCSRTSSIDEKALEAYSLELDGDLKLIEQEIYEMAGGEPFNIQSPKQLGEVLFVRLKLEGGKKTATGQLSTNEETLMQLAEKHPIVNKILEYRQLAKLKSTYVDALPLLVNPISGKLHTTFSQAVTATGRLSSSNPNLQNIPIRSDKGREVRRAFIPSKPDHVILAADYSQIELRIMAALSQDEGMMEAFQNQEDIHTATAAKIFNVPLSEVNSDMRRKAKTANFGIIYGISAFGLALRLNIKRTEAKKIIDTYFAKYPAVKKYMDHCINSARATGYVETMLGRKRYLRDINSANFTTKGFAERTAINTPIQGTAADMLKKAMILIQKELKSTSLKSKMILQVHDELLFDVPNDEIEIIKPLILKAMKEALVLNGVPIEVNIGLGQNWLDAH